MPLTSKLKIFVSSFILYFSMEIYANELIPPKEILGNKILEHYFLKVKQSYDDLNHKIEVCHKQEKNNSITSFNYNDINLQSIDKFKFILYIYTKNQDSCSKESFKNLTYEIFMFRSLLKENKIKKLVFLDNIMSSLAVPSLMEEELKTEFAYKKLPSNTKEYLEKSLGKKPFNFRPFMDKQTEEYERERELRLKK